MANSGYRTILPIPLGISGGVAPAAPAVVIPVGRGHGPFPFAVSSPKTVSAPEPPVAVIPVGRGFGPLPFMVGSPPVVAAAVAAARSRWLKRRRIYVDPEEIMRDDQEVFEIISMATIQGIID